MKVILVLVICIVACILGASLQLALEEKLQFNKGICRVCGKRLTQIPFQLKHGRAYWCDCGNIVIVDFKSTDKKFLKN